MSKIKEKSNDIKNNLEKLLKDIELCGDIIIVSKNQNLQGYKEASINYSKSKKYVGDCLLAISSYCDKYPEQSEKSMTELKTIREGLKKHGKCFYDLMQLFSNIDVSGAKNFINNCDKVYDSTFEIISDLNELIKKIGGFKWKLDLMVLITITQILL
jgi:phosphate uptake regulator